MNALSLTETCLIKSLHWHLLNLPQGTWSLGTTYVLSLIIRDLEQICYNLLICFKLILVSRNDNIYLPGQYEDSIKIDNRWYAFSIDLAPDKNSLPGRCCPTGARIETLKQWESASESQHIRSPGQVANVRYIFVEWIINLSFKNISPSFHPQRLSPIWMIAVTTVFPAFSLQSPSIQLIFQIDRYHLSLELSRSSVNFLAWFMLHIFFFLLDSYYTTRLIFFTTFSLALCLTAHFLSELCPLILFHLSLLISSSMTLALVSR